MIKFIFPLWLHCFVDFSSASNWTGFLCSNGLHYVEPAQRCHNFDQDYYNCTKIEPSICTVVYDRLNCQGRSTKFTPANECPTATSLDRLYGQNLQFQVQSFRQCSEEEKYCWFHLASYDSSKKGKLFNTCQNMGMSEMKVSGNCVKLYKSPDCIGTSRAVKVEDFVILSQLPLLEKGHAISNYQSFGSCNRDDISWNAIVKKVVYHVDDEWAGSKIVNQTLNISVHENQEMTVREVLYNIRNILTENFIVEVSISNISELLSLDFRKIGTSKHLESKVNLNETFTNAVNWSNVPRMEQIGFINSINNSLNDFLSYLLTFRDPVYQVKNRREIEFFKKVQLHCKSNLEIRSIIKFVRNLYVKFDLFLSISGTFGGKTLTALDLRTIFGLEFAEIVRNGSTSVTVKLNGAITANVILQRLLETKETRISTLDTGSCQKQDESLMTIPGIYIGPIGLLILGVIATQYFLCRKCRNGRLQEIPREDPFEGTIYYYNPEEYRFPRTHTNCNSEVDI